MLATMTIPSVAGVSQTYPLHLEMHQGKPVLMSREGRIVTGSYFQLLRDRMGASIETPDVEVIAGLLGVPKTEPGISRTS